MSVLLTPNAVRDFRNILVYTHQNWGDSQRRAYRAAVRRSLELLSQHPNIGRTRDDLFTGCREMHVEQHLIYYYLVESGTVEVVRILHQRQDPGGKVTRPD